MLSLLLAAQSPITVDNLRPNTTLTYPLALIRGSAPGGSVRVEGVEFPVVNGRYVALAKLKKGANQIDIESGTAKSAFKLRYEPEPNERKVVTVWVVGSDGDGKHYTTFPDRPQRINEKLDLALRMMQTFSAESMNDRGYGRKTFDIDESPNADVKVHIVKSPKTTAELRGMDGNAIWGHVYGLCQQKFSDRTTKWMAVMSFTDYIPEEKKARAHFALGGGALAGFGGASMDYWPATLKDLPAAFADTSTIDPAVRFEDSGNRFTAWTQLATAYGAMLHELGHTLGLPHSNDRFDIMSRGFDHFNRRFFVQEPPIKNRPTPLEIKPEETSSWSEYFAARLNWSPWFNPDLEIKGRDPRVEIKNERVIFTAPNGIRVIGADRDGTTPEWRQFKGNNPPRTHVWLLSDLRAKMGKGGNYRITLVDSEGRQVGIEDKPEP